MLETLFLLALSSQRLSFMWLTQEIFRPAREGFSWLGPRVRYFVNCPYCISVWAAFIVYILWNISWLGQLLVWGFAISLFGAVLNAGITYIETLGRKVAQ